MYRHGDLILIPSDQEPPATARPTRSLVLAEGEETGHKHVLTGDVIGWSNWSRAPTFVAVREKPAMLTHEEHAPLAIPPGVYEVRRQRIYEPQSPTESRWVKD
jgi:hypothetical protein